MKNDLQHAIQLRSEKKLVESNQLLLELIKVNPDDAYLNYQCAWSFDVLSEEEEAVPFYEKDIQGDLSTTDLENAYLGLGSTYRSLGNYQQSHDTFLKGITLFPENNALKTFFAMTLYNLNQPHKAVSLLLTCLTETTKDKNILDYQKAIKFYAEDLDKTWA